MTTQEGKAHDDHEWSVAPYVHSSPERTNGVVSEESKGRSEGLKG